MKVHRSTSLLGMALSAGLLALPGQALAHAHLKNSAPAANAATASPATISLTFSEKIEPKFSGFEVTAASGVKAPLAVTASKDGRTLTAPINTPLLAGAYKVTWHVVSDDGHRMDGDYSFTVK
jgi:methionine-rich copper-binding protein CopC